MELAPHATRSIASTGCPWTQLPAGPGRPLTGLWQQRLLDRLQLQGRPRSWFASASSERSRETGPRCASSWIGFYRGKERTIELALPEIKSASDAVTAGGVIAAAAAAGEITPTEAAAMSNLVSNITEAIEVTELEERIAALEAARGSKVP